MNRAVRFAPLVLLVLLLAGLIWRLATPADTVVTSKLVGQPVPAFTLPPALPTKPGLASADLVGRRPRLVNVFASWCLPCITEVRVLQQLKRRGAAIDGIAVRDPPQDVAAFLARNGDPYERIGSDARSEVQIALGASGVPESFIVDRGGTIRYLHVGPIEARDVSTILQKLEEAE